MIKGASDIPDLRLKVLKRTIESFMVEPNLVLKNMFPSYDNESDTIEWETITGSRGMTPFVAPGAEAPVTTLKGHGAGMAQAAYWKEKIGYDENFLNNLRQVGTREKYMPAKRRLARDLRQLTNRCDRREEWMFAQMLTVGSFDYKQRGGIKISVDYGIPSANQVTLADNRKWDNGSSRDIYEDVWDAKLTLQDDQNVQVTDALLTSEVFKLLLFDTGLRDVLQKSTFGDGDLFARPAQVLSTLFGINLIVYDEQYQIEAFLTSNLSANGTTIYVDDPTDFVSGQTLKVHDMSEEDTYESLTISAVNKESGTITVSSGPSNSYKAGEDKVTMTKKFLPTNKFVMFARNVEGDPIAEYYKAPFGLAREWGRKTKTWDKEDPEYRWIMVENKGLPVLLKPKGVYQLTVK